MKILLLGGFFGSGKTTLLSQLIPAMLARGQRICIIENEVGEYAIDNLLLQRGGIEVTTIRGGCVCCQVTGSLLEALQRIDREINPEWVLVELTGIAFLDPLRDTIQTYWPEHGPIVTVSVVDAARWSKLRRAAAPIVTRQVQGGDLIVINKIDLNPDTDAIQADVRELVSDPHFLLTQATQDSGEALAKRLEQMSAI